ncbi:MAG: hypothetical protein RIF41_19710 [Polyangiaceae bacterium]
MTKRSSLVPLALFAILTACSGSSSESPWPVEPLDTDPGPAGERLQRGNVIATEDLPNNYGAGGGDPEEDPDEDPDEEEPEGE